jgi:hypothetical protein
VTACNAKALPELADEYLETVNQKELKTNWVKFVTIVLK